LATLAALGKVISECSYCKHRFPVEKLKQLKNIFLLSS
jgi:hypothetical protein